MIVDAATPVPVRGDQDLMREAVSNLIDNAIKFTPAGGAVRIEARTVDGRPLRFVSDTGVGVPAAGADEDLRPFLSRRAERSNRRDTGSVSASPRRSPICTASN